MEAQPACSVHGFTVLMTWKTLILMMVGLVLGIFVGVLPGLGGANGVAILLPLTPRWSRPRPLCFCPAFIGARCSAVRSLPYCFSIFPGEAWSVATTFDGYPMAPKGRAAKALNTAFTSSFIGALVAMMLITFLAPSLADLALRLGPPGSFAVELLTFCSL